MRGSPLLAAIAAFLAIGLLGIPLWRLTHPGSAEVSLPTMPEQDEQAIETVRFEMTFTFPPNSVEMDHLGKQLWTVEKPGTDLEKESELAWPDEGIDLRVRVDWPEDAPMAAARVRVIDPRGIEHEKSIFSHGPADEVLTFQ